MPSDTSPYIAFTSSCEGMSRVRSTSFLFSCGKGDLSLSNSPPGGVLSYRNRAGGWGRWVGKLWGGVVGGVSVHGEYLGVIALRTYVHSSSVKCAAPTYKMTV